MWPLRWLLPTAALATVARAAPGLPVVLAGPPQALAVTVYRAPEASRGAMDLDRLGGFALISETREVTIPEGDSRLEFAGVADGIEPASAIVTGLDVLEKDRDAALLSPSALMAAAAGRPVEIVRREPRTGRIERLPGTILSDAGGGVIFETAEGIEALRCSGLPETVEYRETERLPPHPVLSVRVRSAAPAAARVTLSYLARGFDWAADYSATVSDDGRSMDLGAWVTLANGNGVSFPQAAAQVVAGRVNRVSGLVEPLDIGGPVLANCWPRGSTSDIPAPMQLQLGLPRDAKLAELAMAAGRAAPTAAAALMAPTVQEESLGDLKLYRVPEPTILAARQSKQVRLLDRDGIPIDLWYIADLPAAADEIHLQASKVLRTTNDAAHHLGLPLPAGRVQVFVRHHGERLLEQLSSLEDRAVNEEVELRLGSSADVGVAASRNGEAHRVEVSNASPAAIRIELALPLPDGVRVAASDRKIATRNGRPVIRLTVPAESVATATYRTHGPGR